MAGCSVTLLKLDDEMLRLWDAPVRTPALRWGVLTMTMAEAGPSTPPAAATRWLRRFAELVAEHRDELTALDAAIGDADHGTNMDRGMTAVAAALAGRRTAGRRRARCSSRSG